VRAGDGDAELELGSHTKSDGEYDKRCIGNDDKLIAREALREEDAHATTGDALREESAGGT